MSGPTRKQRRDDGMPGRPPPSCTADWVSTAHVAGVPPVQRHRLCHPRQRSQLPFQAALQGGGGGGGGGFRATLALDSKRRRGTRACGRRPPASRCRPRGSLPDAIPVFYFLSPTDPPSCCGRWPHGTKRTEHACMHACGCPERGPDGTLKGCPAAGQVLPGAVRAQQKLGQGSGDQYRGEGRQRAGPWRGRHLRWHGSTEIGHPSAACTPPLQQHACSPSTARVTNQAFRSEVRCRERQQGRQ